MATREFVRNQSMKPIAISFTIYSLSTTFARAHASSVWQRGRPYPLTKLPLSFVACTQCNPLSARQLREIYRINLSSCNIAVHIPRMAMLAPSTRGIRPSVRSCAARGRRSIVCKAKIQATTPNTANYPEWVPEQAVPALKFLQATDFKLEESDLYKSYLKQYVETEIFKQSTGWKELPETINGRAAMLGFVVCASAEVFGAGSVLAQLSHAPLAVLLALGLVAAASTIPIYKGLQGDYLAALRDTHSLPEGVFTEPNERLHGRLAMLGVTGLILVEALLGRALL